MDINNNPTRYSTKYLTKSTKNLYSDNPLAQSPHSSAVQNQVAGLTKQHFKQYLNWLKQEYKRLHTPQQDKEACEDLPTWMQNRKLLVRVFIVWIMLAGYMLFSVFSHHNF